MKEFAQKVMKLSVAALVVSGALVTARADVNPGETITKENMSKVDDLVSPGIKWCLQRGMQLKISPYKKVEWNHEFREATEKYSGQVKLSDDGRRLEGHVAGLPFPKLDPNDP